MDGLTNRPYILYSCALIKILLINIFTKEYLKITWDKPFVVYGKIRRGILVIKFLSLVLPFGL